MVLAAADPGPLLVAGRVSQAVLVLCAVAVLAAAGALVPRVRRVLRLARLVEVRARLAQVQLGEDVSRFGGRRRELVELARPWRRAAFWLRHPLTRALLRSYRPR